MQQSQAYVYLYRKVEIAPDVKLSDLLGLLNACPALIDIYGPCCPAGLAEAARLGPQAPNSDTATLEYLELFRLWDYDGDSNTYTGRDSVELAGVGPYSGGELMEFQAFGIQPPNGKQHWCVNLASARTLLHLPVRLNPRIGWVGTPKKPPQAVYRQDFLLGDVLHGLLRNLSCFDDDDRLEDQLEDKLDCLLEDLDALLRSEQSD